MGVTRGEEPAELARLRRRFSIWRASRSAGQRIPTALWCAATQVAVEHGLSRTASALQLDYYALKKRVDELSNSQPSTTTPTFIELSPSKFTTSECLIEMENAHGARLRVYLKGQSLDLLSLSRLMLDVSCEVLTVLGTALSLISAVGEMIRIDWVSGSPTLNVYVGRCSTSGIL